MKNFIPFRIAALTFIAAFIVNATCAEASVNFLGVAAGDATTNDVTVWARAKDEANPQPTDINVQISTDPTFTTGVTTLLAGTADAPTDYTVKTNVGSLDSGTVYYYRFQTTDAALQQVRSNNRPREHSIVKTIVAPDASLMLSYGALKLLPFWDPLRGDPRFEKIVASCAPKE